MTTITPPRSLEQRLAALARANDVRMARARLKEALRYGDCDLAVLLIRDPTPVVEAMRVEDLLLAVPKLGRVKVTRILQHAGVSRWKTLGGLTDRQREALAEAIEARVR